MSNFSFSSFDRKDRIETLSKEHFDLVVIGGGATGTGIALDAASRGLKTALVEKGDFGSGTSSKSTKLIHGGLRYLKQLNLGLVRESGTERAVVNKLAPHLCIPEKMLLPFIKGGTFGKQSTSLALWVYDLLAGVEKSDRRIMLSKQEAQEKEPLLDGRYLKGAGYYAEYRTDDARLTIELVKKAASHGAIAINYIKATSFIYDAGNKITGVKCKDELEGNEIDISAKYVVSAGGPWVDELRKKNNSITKKRLRLTKGVHIVVPHHRLPLSQSAYFDVPDGRMIFAIPRGKISYVGTTDTTYTADKNRVVATELDRDYLLKAVNNMFPSVNLTRYDIISNWAGLRPLIHEEGKSPSELSRKDEIFEAPDGLISIAGGKLTGYRKMAERIVDMVMKGLSDKGGLKYKDATTKTIQLTPDPLANNTAVQQYIDEKKKVCTGLNLAPYYGWYLVTNYGRQTEDILARFSDGDSQDPEIRLALAELSHCMEQEMTQRAEDFFVRRTGRLYFDILSIEKIRSAIMTIMASRLNWSDSRLEQEEEILDLLIQDATHYYTDEAKPKLAEHQLSSAK